MVTHFRLTQFGELITIIACITIAADVIQEKYFAKNVFKYVYRTIVSTLQIFARTEEHTRKFTTNSSPTQTTNTNLSTRLRTIN